VGRVHSSLEAAQEVQEILLPVLIEPVEVVDDRVRLRRSERRVSRALVPLDRLEEIRGPPIVQEEDALSQAPQGAVLNSSPWAPPCRILSARPGPMACTKTSENRLTAWFLSAATVLLPVVSIGV